MKKFVHLVIPLLLLCSPSHAAWTPNKTTIANEDSFLFSDNSEIEGSRTGYIAFENLKLNILNSETDPLFLAWDKDYTDLINKPTIPTLTSELINDSSFLTVEVDGSITNEIQSLSIVGNELTISGGNTISLPDAVVNESDPVFLLWDKSYSDLIDKPTIPSALSDLSQDTTHRIVTDTEKSTWNAKLGSESDPLYSAWDKDFNDLINKPTVPTLVSQLTNDSNYLITEVDGSTTNELQNLSIDGQTLSISNGNSIELPSTSVLEEDPLFTLWGYDYNTLINKPTIPSALSELTEDTTHRLITDAERIDWNLKIGTETDPTFTSWDKSYNDLIDKPTIPTDNAQLLNGANYIIVESDPDFNAWDKDYVDLINKPTIPTNNNQLTNGAGYLTTEVDGSVTNEIQSLSILDDQLTISGGNSVTVPIVTQTIIDAIAANTAKVGVTVEEQNVNADWNSVSGDSQILNKPTIPTTLASLSDDSTHRVVTDTEKSTWNSKEPSLGTGTNGDLLTLIAGERGWITPTEVICNVPLVCENSVFSLNDSGVTPGSFTNSNITVNSKGLITSVSNGTSSGSIWDIFPEYEDSAFVSGIAKNSTHIAFHNGNIWLTVAGIDTLDPTPIEGVTAVDDFNDGTNLSSLSSSGNWTHPNAPSGAWADARYVSDQVVGTASRASLAYWSNDTFSSDHKSCLTVNVLGTGGPGARIQPSIGFTGYTVMTASGNYILKVSDTTVATYEAQEISDIVCVRALGSSPVAVIVSINGIDQTTYNDESNTYTTGQPGLRTYGNTFYGDNWLGEDL